MNNRFQHISNLKIVLSHIEVMLLNPKGFFLFFSFCFNYEYTRVLHSQKRKKASCIFNKGKMNN